jgi:uncharacterized membrane protein (DUF485 family)
MPEPADSSSPPGARVPGGFAPGSQDWETLAATPEFQALLRAKRRFIIPATIFFVVYYFALPVSVGYFPELMQKEIIGRINLAYLFALSQFIMAWVLAWLYLRAANRFDEQARELLELRLKGRKA